MSKSVSVISFHVFPSNQVSLQIACLPPPLPSIHPHPHQPCLSIPLAPVLYLFDSHFPLFFPSSSLLHYLLPIYSSRQSGRRMLPPFHFNFYLLSTHRCHRVTTAPPGRACHHTTSSVVEQTNTNRIRNPPLLFPLPPSLQPLSRSSLPSLFPSLLPSLLLYSTSHAAAISALHRDA